MVLDIMASKKNSEPNYSLIEEFAGEAIFVWEGETKTLGMVAHPTCEEPPWSARNFIPYWSQVLSATAQRAAAAEILNRVREEVATRNAMHARGA